MSNLRDTLASIERCWSNGIGWRLYWESFAFGVQYTGKSGRTWASA